MTKPRNKLTKVNVPELVVQRFIVGENRSGALVSKILSTPAVKRGQGHTRVLENLTASEWEELYQIAATGRAQMIGADRETTLRPAICAKAMAERMEKLGVDNPVVYTPKRTTSTASTNAPVTTSVEEDDTDLSSTVNIPVTPPTVNRGEGVEEVNEDELDSFARDLGFNVQ